MKLSKSQRLFVQIGRIDYLLLQIREFYKYDKRHGILVRDDASRIKRLKDKRKKLIREAVRAADEELDEAWHEGLCVGCDYEI